MSGIKYNLKQNDMQTEEQFKNVVKPLMKYLAENHHPHTKVIVENNCAELVEGMKVIHTDEFIID